MIAIRLVAEAVAIGLHPDPLLFGEVTISEWIALRRRSLSTRKS